MAVETVVADNSSVTAAADAVVEAVTAVLGKMTVAAGRKLFAEDYADVFEEMVMG